MIYIVILALFNIWGVCPPFWPPTGGVERGSISNINQHGLKMLRTKFGAFFTIWTIFLLFTGLVWRLFISPLSLWMTVKLTRRPNYYGGGGGIIQKLWYFSVKILVGLKCTNKLHSLRLQTILYLKIRYNFWKSWTITRPICTFIATNKIYQLFITFIVKPNDMYLFGNLHILKVHLSVQLDMCACKNHCRMKYLYRFIP